MAASSIAWVALLALFGLLALALAVLLRIARRERRRDERDRLRPWIRGLWLQMLAWPAFALATGAAGAPAAALACGMLLGGYVEQGRALERLFVGRPSPAAVRALGPLLVLALMLLPGLGVDPRLTAALPWAAALAAALWFGLRLHLRNARRPSEVERATMVVFAVGAAIAALRLAEIGLTGRAAWTPTALAPIQALALLYVLVAPLLASVGFLLMHQERQRQRLERVAASDPLTATFNRTGFLKHGARVLRRARYMRMPLAATMIDVDHVKHINDSFGHAAGDAVLTAVARAIEASVRPADLLARYGGDEFALLCAADERQARAIAERIGREVRALRIEWEGQWLRTTLSIGVAQARHDAEETLEQLLREADRQLYAAKLDGRDRSAVALADDD